MSTVGLDMNQVSELTTLHPEARTVRAETVEEALEVARRELGVKDVRVLQASRMRRGGVGGFFARELGVELVVAPAEQESFEKMLTVGRAYSEPELNREYVTEAALAMIENVVVQGSAVIDERIERPSWASVEPAAVINPKLLEQDEPDTQFQTTVSDSSTVTFAPAGMDEFFNAHDAGVVDLQRQDDATAASSAVSRSVEAELASEAVELDVSEQHADNAHQADHAHVRAIVDVAADHAEELTVNEHVEVEIIDLAATSKDQVNPEQPINEPAHDTALESIDQVDGKTDNIAEITAALANLAPSPLLNDEPRITAALRDTELSLLQERLGRELRSTLAPSEPQPQQEAPNESMAKPALDGEDLLKAMSTAIASATEPALQQQAPRPRIEADASKWQASRNLRHQVEHDAEEARASLLEVSDTRIESFRTRYAQPTRQAPQAPPAQSTQSRQMLAALGSIGIPTRVVGAVANGATLRAALESVSYASPKMQAVTLVVGHGPLVRQWAAGIAAAAGLDEGAVVYATTMRRNKDDVCGVEELEEWRSHNLVTPVIVAIDAHSPGTNEGYIKRMIQVVRPNETRLVLDADDERSASLWSRLAPDAMLDVVRTRHARRPGTFLQLGMPLATIDGETASAATLALALFEHAAK
jgi:hypothetical protein